MKRATKYIFLSFCTIFYIISCDVDRYPETEVSDETFWKSEADLKLATNYFYNTLPDLDLGGLRHFTWGNFAFEGENPNSISDGSRTKPATSDDYNYEGIFQANNIIEKADNVIKEGGIEDEVHHYIGEAKFFRAWYYFEMLKRFGGVPIITKTLDVDDEDEIFKKRSSRDEVLELIYSDLDYGIDSLKTPDNVDYGRITNTAALAFKSRVALFEGTRSKFHDYGDSDEHLKLAISTAKQVIKSGYHSLYSTPEPAEDGKVENKAYYNLFQIEGEANDENIIVRKYGENEDNEIITSTVQRQFEARITPTDNFASLYLMADGLPINDSPLYRKPDGNMTLSDYFIGRDPRMDMTIFKKGDEFKNTGPYTIPESANQRTGYGIRKYAEEHMWEMQKSFIDRPVLRYAEVLLNYVEAKYELEGQISDEDLDMTINALRERLPEINVGTSNNPNYKSMELLTNSFVNQNNLSMREEIRRERSVELAFEVEDYWDKIRWKTAEEELPKALLGSYLFTEYYSGGGDWSESTSTNEDGFILVQDSSLRKFDPEKDYLWPIPTNEISKNPDLEQNKGWD